MSNLFKKLMPFLLSGTFLTTASLSGCSRKTISALEGQPLPSHTIEVVEETTPLYPMRDTERAAYLDSLYTRADQDSLDVPDGQMKLWQYLQQLKRSNTLMGPALAEFSAEANIYYRFTSMSNTVGLWHGSDGTVHITSDTVTYSDAYLLSCMAHEIIHGAQEKNGSLKEDMGWTIWDFQRSLLACESAAQVGEYLMALDFYNAQQSDLINCSLNIDVKTKERLLDAFNTAQADTLPHARDLESIGAQEFYKTFDHQWWLDFYNNRVLESYLLNMMTDELTAPTGASYGLETARLTGRITETFNFTAKVDSLPYDMFGDHDRMRQAFAYMECMRLGKTRGYDDTLYLAERAKLVADENRYIDIDLDKVYSQWLSFDNDKDLIDLLDEAVDGPAPPILPWPSNVLRAPGEGR